MKFCADLTAELVRLSAVFLFTRWGKPLLCPDCVILHSGAAKSHQAETHSAADSRIPVNAASRRMINRCSGVFVGESVSLMVWRCLLNRLQLPSSSRCLLMKANKLLSLCTPDYVSEFIATHDC